MFLAKNIYLSPSFCYSAVGKSSQPSSACKLICRMRVIIITRILRHIIKAFCNFLIPSGCLLLHVHCFWLFSSCVSFSSDILYKQLIMLEDFTKISLRSETLDLLLRCINCFQKVLKFTSSGVHLRRIHQSSFMITNVKNSFNKHFPSSPYTYVRPNINKSRRMQRTKQ